MDKQNTSGFIEILKKQTELFQRSIDQHKKFLKEQTELVQRSLDQYKENVKEANQRDQDDHRTSTGTAED